MERFRKEELKIQSAKFKVTVENVKKIFLIAHFL